MNASDIMTDLFAYQLPPAAHARTHDPDTSHEAAESISPRLRALQARVLAYAASEPDGFTDRDLEAAMGDSGSTWRTRRSELAAKGYIRDSGERRTHGTGRRHIVWIITSEGLKAND